MGQPFGEDGESRKADVPERGVGDRHSVTH